MQALVYHGPEKKKWEDVPKPELKIILTGK